MRSKICHLLVKVMLLTLLVLVMFPFLWMLLSSFKDSSAIISWPPKFWPRVWTLDNYLQVWSSIPLLKFLSNTVVFTMGVVFLSLLFDSLAGYAFARYEFKWKKQLFGLVLITMMVPFQVLMIPLFVQEYKMGILNSFAGLILPRATSAFGIFMMRSFFMTLPKELEESGRLDGMSEFRIFWSIMLPISKPAVISLGVILFVNNWNDLIYPLMLTNSTEMRTLSAGLAMFVGDKVIAYGPILAATVIAVLPLIVLFVFLQKYFIEGISTAGMKG